MKKRVWSLYRVSTDRQGGEGEDDIPLQKEACDKFAADKDWEVTNEIYEKLSGFKNAMEDRESITEILEAVKNDELDILLVYHSDRIGRQVEYSTFITLLYEKGVQVWSTKEGELRNVAHEDGLINYIRFWTSEGESKKTSARVKDRMEQLNEEGGYVGGNPPYGYKIIDTGEKRNSKNPKSIKAQVIEETERETVKQIFELVRSDFYGASRIAQYLNGIGSTNRGKIWRHNTISRMLRNPIYMGRKRYNTMASAGDKTVKRITLPREEWKLQPYNPALDIVTEDVFNKVQSIIDKRASNRQKSRIPSSSQVLLSGMIVCGYCGNKMVSDYSTNSYKRKDGTTTKNKVYRYRCNHSKNLSGKNNKHEQSQYGAKTMDKHVEGHIFHILDAFDFEAFDEEKDLLETNELNNKNSSLEKLEKELSDVGVAYENTVKLFDDVMMGKSTMNLEFVQERLSKYETKKEQIEKNMEVLRNEIINIELNTNELINIRRELATWVESYNGLSSLEDRKGTLGKILDEVVVKKDDIVIRFQVGIRKALSI